MSQGDAPSASGPERDDHSDLVQFGRRRQPRRRRAAWAALTAAAAVGGVIVVVLTAYGGKPPAAAPPLLVTTPPPPSPAPPAPPSPVTVTRVGHRLLGATGNWELYALAPAAAEVIRIQPAQGLVTRTTFPGLDSGGAVSFVAGPGQAIVRPFDFVPGYLVADGRPVRQLTGALGNGGPAFPGPVPGQVWATTGDADHTSLALVRMDGTTLGLSFPVPDGNGSVLGAVPDGSGHVLVPEPGGWYDARPGAFSLVTRGTVVAVGPTRWLVVECRGSTHCAKVVIDPASGTRRILPWNGMSWWHPDTAVFPGVISPDGSAAAVPGPGRAGGATLHLIDLASGADRQFAMQGSPLAGTTVWSPDSRWLFLAGSAEADLPLQPEPLLAVNARTGRAVGLGVTLPPVSQLAVVSPPP